MQIRIIRDQVAERPYQNVEPFHVANETDEKQMVWVARLVLPGCDEDALIDDVRDDVDRHCIAVERDDALPKRLAHRRYACDPRERTLDLASDGSVTIEPRPPHRVLR